VDSRRLLVVHHSRSGTTASLRDVAVAAASELVDVRSLGAFDAGVDDVLWAEAVLLCTPANFGYMSGALKDFFERIYHTCLGKTVALPYGLIVKGDTDVDGAVSSVTRILAGLQWRQGFPPVTVIGPVSAADLERAAELGGAMAASLEAGLW
jgi:NAD(P)H-dependent FMN reductase